MWTGGENACVDASSEPIILVENLLICIEANGSGARAGGFRSRGKARRHLQERHRLRLRRLLRCARHRHDGAYRGRRRGMCSSATVLAYWCTRSFPGATRRPAPDEGSRPLRLSVPRTCALVGEVADAAFDERLERVVGDVRVNARARALAVPHLAEHAPVGARDALDGV